MSFPSGRSAERGRLSPPSRASGAALALVAAFAIMIGFVRFPTMSAGGIERLRTAPFVWQTAPAVVGRFVPFSVAPLLFAISVGVVVVGCFALLWLSVGVAADPDERVAPEIRATYRNVVGALAIPVRFGPEPARLCAAAIAVLSIYAAWQMGLWAPLRDAGVFDTFASYDHPFHVARVETLLRSLRSGHALRWVASHQGGYPAEFYPFGFAWFEAVIWAAGLGRLPVEVVHRFAVIALFLIPAAIFHVMARRDGWPALVGVAAFALHVAVPGEAWSGGYGELVLMGLVANVSAAFAVVVAMVAATDAFARGRGRGTGVASLAAAAAIWCNPRSALGLVACVGAAWVVALWRSDWRRATGQLVVIAATAALLAAPELVSLVRFGNLYYFVRYTSYTSSLDYVAASIDAVSLPAFVLALAGAAAASVVPRRHVVTKTVAVALAAYSLMTIVFSFGPSSLIEQLETTRLMPVQRMLTIYLAAVGLQAVSAIARDRWRLPAWTPAAIQAIVVTALLALYLGPLRLMPFWARGLYPVERSSVPAMATFQQVLTLADRQAPPGTAILVVGSALSTGHQQLWAPVRSDRLFFYDEWMWYWHTRHRGPYDPQRESKYDADRLDEIFDREYLDRNAIGAVIVAEAEQLDADAAPALRRVFGGTYGLYAVDDPTRVVTLAGRAAETITVENERIVAEGTSAGGEALVRRNWFPRWRALVNDQPRPVAETVDGYMRVPVPAGRVRLVLSYELQQADAAARVAALVGIVVLAMLLRRGRQRFVAPAL